MQVWLKQPLVSLADITTRHDVVEALSSDPELRERLRDLHLRGARCVVHFSRVPSQSAGGAVESPVCVQPNCWGMLSCCFAWQRLVLQRRDSMW